MLSATTKCEQCGQKVRAVIGTTDDGNVFVQLSAHGGCEAQRVILHDARNTTADYR